MLWPMLLDAGRKLSGLVRLTLALPTTSLACCQPPATCQAFDRLACAHAFEHPRSCSHVCLRPNQLARAAAAGERDNDPAARRPQPWQGAPGGLATLAALAAGCSCVPWRPCASAACACKLYLPQPHDGSPIQPTLACPALSPLALPLPPTPPPRLPRCTTPGARSSSGGTPWCGSLTSASTPSPSTRRR